MYFVPLLHKETDLVDQTLRIVTEEQILQDHRTKYGSLHQKLQGLWERFAEDENECHLYGMSSIKKSINTTTIS